MKGRLRIVKCLSQVIQCLLFRVHLLVVHCP